MKDFSTVLVLDATPMEVYNAINNVRGWWSEEIEGDTDKLLAVFQYRYKDIHHSKIKVAELLPGKRVEWFVLDNYFSFTDDKHEWKDTKVIFDIARKDGKTRLQVTHLGLVPEYECFNVCQDAWTTYIQNSLRGLIVSGQGQPNPKEGVGINTQIAEKWNLE
jgi:hypothetical protein